ncbi:hypothetical protein PVAP13_4NG261611 [Panicum virgatum]|uniref:Uncharacterized protein n=1 Tax=Panicum virgatum TaxID=38727 RepID=A0A8T0TG59_PANVG|nr:hypothetical protein PVAP13_4NG261611 [Panicum virgatum]
MGPGRAPGASSLTRSLISPSDATLRRRSNGRGLRRRYCFKICGNGALTLLDPALARETQQAIPLPRSPIPAAPTAEDHPASLRPPSPHPEPTREAGDEILACGRRTEGLIDGAESAAGGTRPRGGRQRRSLVAAARRAGWRGGAGSDLDSGGGAGGIWSMEAASSLNRGLGTLGCNCGVQPISKPKQAA